MNIKILGLVLSLATCHCPHCPQAPLSKAVLEDVYDALVAIFEKDHSSVVRLRDVDFQVMVMLLDQAAEIVSCGKGRLR